MSILSLWLHGDGDVLVGLLACLLAHPSVVLTTCGRRMAALDCHPRPAHCSTQWTVGQLLLELVPFDIRHMGVDDLLRHSLRQPIGVVVLSVDLGRVDGVVFELLL